MNRDNMLLKPIAYMHNAFPTKFGLPRQSGLVDELVGQVVFEPEFRNNDALRGIEDFSHLWLIWGFSKTLKNGWSPLVRPPRLGGVKRMGVFATRSPNRPNPIAMSCVKLQCISESDENGKVLVVSGIDMMDGTPIYDIKPYIPYADSKPDAAGSFAEAGKDYHLDVCFPDELYNRLPESAKIPVVGVLKCDPRPAYHNDPKRIYGVEYDGVDVRFTVSEKRLTVVDVVKTGDKEHHIFKTSYTE